MALQSDPPHLGDITDAAAAAFLGVLLAIVGIIIFAMYPEGDMGTLGAWMTLIGTLLFLFGPVFYTVRGTWHWLQQQTSAE